MKEEKTKKKILLINFLYIIHYISLSARRSNKNNIKYDTVKILY